MRTLPCQKEMPFEVRQIKPSAMYFNQEKLKEIGNTTAVHVGGKGEFWRVCYSCHSSLQELLEFVKYLQPKSIIPTVLPNNTSETEVISLLAKVLEDENINGNEIEEFDMYNLGSPPSKKKVENDSKPSMLGDIDEIITPPKDTENRQLLKRKLLGVNNDNEIMKSPEKIPKKKLNMDESKDDDDIEILHERINSRRMNFRASKMSRVACR